MIKYPGHILLSADEVRRMVADDDLMKRLMLPEGDQLPAGVRGIGRALLEAALAGEGYDSAGDDRAFIHSLDAVYKAREGAASELEIAAFETGRLDLDGDDLPPAA